MRNPIPARLRAISCTLLASLVLSAPATAGLIGGLVTHAVERHVTKQVETRFGQPSAAPVALPPAGSFAQCRQLFPLGAPIVITDIDARWRPTALCFNHFAVLYSGLTKTPLVVVERLGREQMAQALDEMRTDEFYADPRLPRASRAELDDFRSGGFDRGHMAPAGDQPDQISMAQSFALSNIIPQDSFNNRKTWSKIESDVRKFVRRSQGSVYVFSGPVFRGEQRTVGRGRVWVPSHLFKLVYDEASGRSWGYILANTAEARVEAPMGYEAFVRETGWSLLAATASNR